MATYLGQAPKYRQTATYNCGLSARNGYDLWCWGFSGGGAQLRMFPDLGIDSKNLRLPPESGNTFARMNTTKTNCEKMQQDLANASSEKQFVLRVYGNRSFTLTPRP